LEINKVTLLKKQVISGIGCDTLFLRNRDVATQKFGTGSITSKKYHPNHMGLMGEFPDEGGYRNSMND
jgi:hypothetical protein